MVNRDKLDEMISPTTGTQEGWDELPKREEFTMILEKEVKAHGLKTKKVRVSFRPSILVVSKPLLSDGGPVMIPYANFTNEDKLLLLPSSSFKRSGQRASGPSRRALVKRTKTQTMKTNIP
ncbi:hypothetical protein B9Z19DRAFT_1134974 [Tuber borchii]|uniref:Uncharacterized protein n=1 Tax=Tuber borchii TaxID=42251 RepID=A0A2T6ZDI3_TUBBO|nr:hypothetical protein B9Z19DRAFT_1134974 [Tuber borchii]